MMWTRCFMLKLFLSSFVFPSYSQFSEGTVMETINLSFDCGRWFHCTEKSEWIVGDQVVTNITGLRYIFKNGTLYFPPYDRSKYKPEIHSSIYRCRLRGDKMADDGHILRTVKVTTTDPLAKSRQRRQDMMMMERFRPQAINPGATIELWCAARGAAYIVWSRDGTQLNPSGTVPMSSISNSGGVTSLARSSYNITRALPEDAGSYSCTAISKNNETITHEARIDIFGPPYIRSLGPIKLLSGRTATIRCPYYGYPISQVKWERSDLQPIHYERYRRMVNRFVIENISKYDRRRRSFTADEEGRLIIPNIDSSENGAMYTCTVTSPSGEMARRSFEIQVMEPPLLDDLSFPANIQEGQIAKAICSVKSGDTPIFFNWLKDGQPISASLKVEEKNSELFTVLLIKKVGLQHCGVYTCIATNHAAKVNVSAELFIKVAPKWVEEPQNTSLVMGKQGIVGCSASGYPQPQVHWMKMQDSNWRPVLELRGSGLLSLPNGSLVLEMVTSGDGGLYSCRVENGVGQPLHKDIFITVNKPVTFDTTVANITTKINHAVSIMCEVFGDLPIRIFWNHNGRPLEFHHSDRLKITSHQTNKGATSEVLVARSEPGDSGIWICKASNAHGTAQHSTFVTVQEPPGPPTDVSIEGVRGRTVRVGWRSPVIPPSVYLLQYAPHHHLHWDTAVSVNITHIPNQSRQNTELTSLRPATPYAARISSIGVAGSSPFTRPVLFTTLEEVPSSSPLSVHVVSGPGPGELQASWLSPPAHALHGLLLGYIVKAIPQITHHSEEKATVLKVGPTVLQTVLSGLLKSTRYSVTVSCFNSAGLGPPSQPLFRDTPEGAPEVPPEEVECSAVSSTSLRISWRPLPHHLQGGAMLGYTVHYMGVDGTQQNITSVHSSIQVDGLHKFTNYTIWVTGYSRIGQGPPSTPILCTTMEDLPSAPSDVKVLVATSSSLVINWLPPLHPNGRILHYVVYLRPTQGGGTVQSYRITDQIMENSGNQGTLSHAVRSLEQGRKYEAWVTAATVLGEGESSRTVTAEPTDRVVAGVSSLGGRVVAGSSTNLRLACRALGSPQPRTVWYHNSRVITHHPSFTLNTDDSLLINDITPSLEGNYTCVAKNLFGWDSVSYIVSVISPPPPPRLRASPDRRGLLLHWAPPNHTNPILGYTLSWREESHEWFSEDITGGTVGSKKLEDLGCGKQYEVKLIAHGTIGPSSPAIAFATTLGTVMTAPTGTEWIWSNSSHISLQLETWLDGDCGPVKWTVDYRPIASRVWLQPNLMPVENGQYLVIGGLHPAKWYQLRVTATNLAGPTSALYTVATRNLQGEIIGPPSEPMDTSILVMVCSCILLLLCMLVCIFVAIQKHRHRVLCGASSESMYKERSCQQLSAQRPLPVPHNCPPLPQRLYTSPMANRKPSSTNSDMFEISPYAQFSMGFQTFSHVENLDRPAYVKGKQGIFSTETSFQMAGSESDDSDSLSKSGTVNTTQKNKTCRVQYHR